MGRDGELHLHHIPDEFQVCVRLPAREEEGEGLPAPLSPHQDQESPPNQEPSSEDDAQALKCRQYHQLPPQQDQQGPRVQPLVHPCDREDQQGVRTLLPEGVRIRGRPPSPPSPISKGEGRKRLFEVSQQRGGLRNSREDGEHRGREACAGWGPALSERINS